MAARRHLIVNADDFGQSPGVNRGIITAHEQGIVSGASLMVRWAATAEAAAYGREHPSLSLGLHIDLGEWIYRNEAWVPVYEVIETDDAAAVKREVSNQLAAFRRLVGKDPTHIDSHQHVHLREPARSVLIEIARTVHAPLRHFDPLVRYCGNFYGQTAEGSTLPGVICVEGLLKILATLPPGVTELGCHPGEENDLDTAYRDERKEEVRVLCDPRVRTALRSMGIEPCSFDSLNQLMGSNI